MFTVIIALAAGFTTAVFAGRELGWGWGITCGVLVVMAIQLGIGLWIRRKVGAVNGNIQSIMEAAQARIGRKMQFFQQRSGGNVRMAQQMLEKEQNEAIRTALAATKEMEKYFLWNLLLKKQTNTMRMVMYFQLKEFGKVDEMLPKCILLDPRAIAVKMVRMYKKEDPALDKFYAKKTKRFKDEDCALLASLYAWIQVKRNDVEGAMKTLAAAKLKTENQVVADNWERLANGKVKNFSNSGLGDAWYSLYLEEPKIKMQRVQPRF